MSRIFPAANLSPPPNPRIVAIYTRQSRRSDDEFSSCDAQFAICHDFIESQRSEGWQWSGVRYDDDGESGESLDRPELSDLLCDLRAGKIDVVVIHRLDRLSRKVMDLTELLTEFRDRGVALSIVADSALDSSAMSSLIINLLGSFAEFEHELIRERLADTRAAMKRRGLRVAGRVPYGYVADRSTKQLNLCPTEAKRVKKLFRLAAEGKKLSEIAMLANDRGWKTKPTSRYPKGGRWTPRLITDLLANPVYLGLIRVKTGTAPGQHPAIIDQDLFDRVRAIVASRRKSTTARQRGSSDWHLRGLVICGQCGRPMSTSVLYDRQMRYRYYRCRSHAGGRRPCRGVSVPAFQLEQMVCLQLSALKPQKFRLTSRRQMTADFKPLWDELDLHEQFRCLKDIVEKVEFNAQKNKIRFTFRPGAVGAVAGYLIRRDAP